MAKVVCVQHSPSISQQLSTRPIPSPAPGVHAQLISHGFRSKVVLIVSSNDDIVNLFVRPTISNRIYVAQAGGRSGAPTQPRTGRSPFPTTPNSTRPARSLDPLRYPRNKEDDPLSLSHLNSSQRAKHKSQPCRKAAVGRGRPRPAGTRQSKRRARPRAVAPAAFAVAATQTERFIFARGRAALPLAEKGGPGAEGNSGWGLIGMRT